MYYEAVFRFFQQNNIRYAVAGGVALVLHGVVLDVVLAVGYRVNSKRHAAWL